MNHLNLANSEVRQKKTLWDIEKLCNRIMTESEESALTGDAAVLKAMELENRVCWDSADVPKIPISTKK